jgi:single-stranded-DNA-specific exonuclease
MRDWIEPPQAEIPSPLLEAAYENSLVARRLMQCGFSSIEEVRAFLDPYSCIPSSSDEMPGLSLAADRLEEALRKGEKICVWGDFDVDGQTATTILVSALKELGGQVFHHIPVRAVESHGVNLPYLEKVVKSGAELVLTCDTGVTAHDAADYAKHIGIDFIVTDHHDLPPDLPHALAILNPKLLPEAHPMYSLPGVGVAYKLAEELYNRHGRGNASRQHLDLAALGIVADVAFLKGETRRLLQLGLDLLRRTERLGLQMMLEMAGVEQSYLTEEHIGFVLAPRLNALGRLDDANQIVEFLTTNDIGRARFFASHLEALNARRKLLTDQVFQAARSQLEADPSKLDSPVIILSHPAWPAGIIGIVAARLVERYNRPAVLLSAPPGEVARGSARSIPEINITAALSKLSDLLVGFGGHPMAAGLSISLESMPEFQRLLPKIVHEMSGGAALKNHLPIDAYISLSQVDLELAEAINRLAPFGPGNPPLTLACRDLAIKNSASLGRNGDHITITVEDLEGNRNRVVWWQGAGWELPEGRFDLAFNLRAINYSGKREVQLEWVDARPTAAPEIAGSDSASINVLDYRGKPQPLALLKNSLKVEDSLVWCEGEAAAKLRGMGIPCTDRSGLTPCRQLVIWTTPPGSEEIQTALASTNPEEVVLFAVDPDTAHPQVFLTRLSALVKYAVKEKGGITSLLELASATAHRQDSVRQGLTYLEHNGYITARETSPGCYIITIGKGDPSQSKDSLDGLKALLRETAAYRSFYSRADYESVLWGK